MMMHKHYLRALGCACSGISIAYNRRSLECTVGSDFPKSKSFHVLIIGGGIVGASIAHNLKDLSKHSNINLTVGLLEEHTCGSGASGLSAGTIWTAGNGTVSADTAYLNLCSKSMQYYHDMESNGYDCGLVVSGNLILACTEEEAKRLKSEHLHLRSSDHTSVFVPSQDALCKMEPNLKGGSAIAALHTPLSGYIEPLVATNAIRQCAHDRGVVVVESTRAHYIERTANTYAPNTPRYKVHCSDGNIYQAHHVVVAAGVGCPQLLRPLGLQVPIYGVRGTMWESKEPTDFTPIMTNTIYVAESDLAWHRLYSGGIAGGTAGGIAGGTAAARPEIAANAQIPVFPKYCTEDKDGNILTRHCYGRPREDGCVVFGGTRIFESEQTMNCPTTADDDESRVDTVFNHVAELIPSLRTTGRSGGVWSGVMPFSYDGRPLVGHLAPLDPDKYNGLWLAGGFGGDGMMQGPGATQFLSSQLIDTIKQENNTPNNCENRNGRSPRRDVYYEIECAAVSAYMNPLRSRGGVVKTVTSQ